MKPIIKLAAIIFFIAGISFLSCKKNDPLIQANRPPVARAGQDQSIVLPTNMVMLNGNGSTDADKNIAAYLWRKISGPPSFNFMNASVAQTIVNNLAEGVYQFELKLTDADGLTSADTVSVTVHPSLYRLPVAYAGYNVTITLPFDSAFLDGSGSYPPPYSNPSVASFLWTKISGPAQYTFNSANSVATTVKDLVPGTYNFRLEVSDNNGASHADTVQVTVISDPQNINVIIYNDLTWIYSYDIVEEVTVCTPDIPNLFNSPNNFVTQVSIRLGASVDWVSIPDNGFLWQLYNQSYLRVSAIPINYQLPGTNVSIKMKFL